MRARHPSTCPLCRGLIRVGHQIGRTPVGWCHTSCIIDRAKQLETT